MSGGAAAGPADQDRIVYQYLRKHNYDVGLRQLCFVVVVVSAGYVGKLMRKGGV
jgi:hypothetical protein